VRASRGAARRSASSNRKVSGVAEGGASGRKFTGRKAARSDKLTALSEVEGQSLEAKSLRYLALTPWVDRELQKLNLLPLGVILGSGWQICQRDNGCLWGVGLGAGGFQRTNKGWPRTLTYKDSLLDLCTPPSHAPSKR